MYKCRTDSPQYHQTPDWDYVEPTEAELNEKAEEWFTFADPDYNSKIILSCAIEELTSLTEHPEFKDMWMQLMNNIDKLPALKTEMMKYIKTDIEAGNI